MKHNNKFNEGEKVILSETGEKVTINKFNYIQHMKKYSYTLKEKPRTFFFEDEIGKI